MGSFTIYSWNGSCVGPRASLDKGRRQKSLPLPENQPWCSTHPSHYTDRTIIACKMIDKILFTCYVVTQFTADRNMIRFLWSQTIRLKKARYVLFSKCCISSTTASPLWVMQSTNGPRSQHTGISQDKNIKKKSKCWFPPHSHWNSYDIFRHTVKSKKINVMTKLIGQT